MLTPEALDRLEALALSQKGREIGTGVFVKPYELLALIQYARNPLYIVDPKTQSIEVVLDASTERSVSP